VTPEWSETADLRLLQFDPYRYNANRDQRTRREGSLYPQDLEIIGRMTGAAERPTVILASSYSAQNNNPVRRIEASLRKGLEPYGFDLRHRVEANGNMVAFVLTRSLPDLEPLDELEQRFQSWLKAATDKTVAG
jgi:hypothetical protein